VSDEIDPEVLADMQLRSYTEASRPRMSEAAFAAGVRAAATPNVIGVVPCRGRCGAVVDWTEEAEQAFETWNRILLGKREAPLDKTRITFCNSCRARGARLSAENNRKQVDRLAELVRELKDEPPPSPSRERELLEAIKALNHPDVDALVQTIREKRTKSPGKRTRGSELMR
jgi:hypothetical protein